LRKKHAKILKNFRPVGEDTTLAAAVAWKFLKFSRSRRRRGCIYFLSAAAAQKFLKFSPSRRRRLCFLGKIGGGSADRLTPLIMTYCFYSLHRFFEE
jgi:hypothetical protein